MVKFTVLQVMKAQSGSKRHSCTLYLTWALGGVGGQRHASAALRSGKRPGTRCTYMRLAVPPWPVWTGAENLAPTGIRSPGCPAFSESLYRLLNPGPYQVNVYRITDYFISDIRQHVSILTEPSSRR